jgi:hypothetical protein
MLAQFHGDASEGCLSAESGRPWRESIARAMLKAEMRENVETNIFPYPKDLRDHKQIHFEMKPFVFFILNGRAHALAAPYRWRLSVAAP